MLLFCDFKIYTFLLIGKKSECLFK
uniref:Uncharacterized protein n=1 Tax=Arundo donax TaxID=35708 RepID=A0A0A9FIE3_ARUDO